MGKPDWPVELRVAADRSHLKVVMGEGVEHVLPAEYLRVLTPSAERTGHGGNRQVIGGKEGVSIRDVTAVGNYAVRVAFDDGHDTGIYPLASFDALGREQEMNWATYLEELAATGLSRQVPGMAPAPKR